jgi:DNA repair protein RadC
MYIEDKNIHKGHRSRMRAKLEAYGMRIFDTYELLEMLLYYVIPYRDTNPIAKRLLAEFGSLDGVLSAPVSELAAVDGIGEKCAEFISFVGRSMLEEEASTHDYGVTAFNDYHSTGRFLASYFETSKANVCMLMLDGNMRLIEIVDICADNFGSAAIKPKRFIDSVLLSGASVVIIAHKTHSLLYFPESTLATDKMIRAELSNVGVTVAEHYVVSGKDYSGLRTNFALGSPERTPELERFYESVPKDLGGYDEN